MYQGFVCLPILFSAAGQNLLFEGKTMIESIPAGTIDSLSPETTFAKYSDSLQLGEKTVDCYVLNDK